MEIDALKVKFTHSNTVRDKKPYTIYEIEVRSISTITWVIYKRYSAFHALHQELTKIHTQNPSMRLPHLPPKRLTRSLATEFVEKRKQELQEYLRDMLAIPELLHSPTILDFLEVPDSVRPMLTRGPLQKSVYPGFDLKMDELNPDAKERMMSNKADYQHKSYEERRVLELINLLKFHPSRVAAIKNFEDYFFEHRPRLSNEFIRLLFQGKTGADGEGGLVQTSGDFAYSHVASRAALYLLCRLLDVEKNKDAQLFLDQFTSLPVPVLAKMNLHLHILSERGNRLGAFSIVAILKQANSQKGNFSIEDLVSDTWARQEYFRWAERKTDQSTPYTKEVAEAQGKSKSLADGFQAIAKEAFAELLNVAKDDLNWKAVVGMGVEGEWGNDRDAGFGGSGMGSAIMGMAGNGGLINQQQSFGGGLGGGGGGNGGMEAVELCYKKDVFKDVVIMKVTTVFPFPVSHIARFLANVENQKEWDVKFQRGKKLQDLDAHHDVVHMAYKSFSSPYKYRDLCVLRASMPLDNGGRAMCLRSVLHPKAPEGKDNVRAVLFPSGVILTPLTQTTGVEEHSKIVSGVRSLVMAQGHPDGTPSNPANDEPLTLSPQSPASNTQIGRNTGSTLPPNAKAYTKFTFIAQMDRESVLIASPDLLGESEEVRQSIVNLRACLARPTGGPPKH